MARAMYSALMGWMVSLIVILRIWAEAGVAARVIARIRHAVKDIAAIFFVYLVGKISVFFGLRGWDMAWSR